MGEQAENCMRNLRRFQVLNKETDQLTPVARSADSSGQIS
jgi:hypothetical protein